MTKKQKTCFYIGALSSIFCDFSILSQGWQVTQIIEQRDGKQIVVLPFGEESGLTDGMILRSERYVQGQSTDPVETGTIKVVSVGKARSLGTILTDGSLVSHLLFPEFPGIMAGDQLVRPKIEIKRVKVVTEEVAILFRDLFIDPKADPSSLELSEAGKQVISREAEKFRNLKLSMLLVKGFTDWQGDAATNQIESLQRAATVRQYLIDVLGFRADRVEAFGLGESDPKDTTFVDDYRDRNRRIVLKSVPLKVTSK